MINDTDGSLIEMYLDGALEGAALSDFENRLKKESLLQEALAERKSLHRFLQNQPQREQVKKISGEIGKKHFKAAAIIRPLWRRASIQMAGMAAAIALIILVWQPWKQTPLYEQFAQHKTLALAERGSTDLDPIPIENAFVHKNYEQAIPLLKTYLKAYPDAIEASLYLGICQLEGNHFQDSDAIFQNIYAGESSFKYEALWYLSLSAVKQKKEAAAQSYLSLIPEDSQRYQQAQKLLEKLN